MLNKQYVQFQARALRRELRVAKQKNKIELIKKARMVPVLKRGVRNGTHEGGYGER
jgi:hypothetical protein